jgi:two-component system, chemotaxis family, chemotaxis protein CheY
MEAGARVLVVEDDEDLRMLLVDCLTECGFDVAGVADGKAALSYLDENPRPGAIILDMQMQPMTGWEFLDRKRARAELETVPVFAASALRRLDTDPPAGVARAFSKPLDLDALTSALAELLRSGRG